MEGRAYVRGSDGADTGQRAQLVAQVETNGLMYLESSHYCAHLIPELARLFDARFVFLHRDPRGFPRSGLARDHWYPSSRPWREHLKLVLRRKVGVEVGNPWHDHRLEPPAGLKTRIEIAWLWTDINGIIVRDLAVLDSSRTYELRLTDIGPDSFRELLDFLGLGGSPTSIRAMVQVAQRKPNRQIREPTLADEWDEPAFRSITGSMARRLGCGAE